MEKIDVRREQDGELLGFVEPAADGSWRALTVFGAELSRAADREEAVRTVETTGLASLAERWWYWDGDDWRPATIREAGPDRVVASVGDAASFSGVIGSEVTLPRTFTGADAAALRRQPG